MRQITICIHRKILPMLALAGLAAALGVAAPASAQEYGGGAAQGYIGQEPAPFKPGSVTSAQSAADPAPPTLPPVFDTVRAGENEDEKAPAIADPCADFAGSYDAYNVCQDRIKKIERMRDAKNRRMGVSPAPAPAAAEKPVTPEDAAAKVDELERKLQEKADADAAAKAAPTTKKGIGEFNRNPDKGKPLFK